VELRLRSGGTHNTQQKPGPQQHAVNVSRSCDPFFFLACFARKEINIIFHLHPIMNAAGSGQTTSRSAPGTSTGHHVANDEPGHDSMTSRD
jgi:hypothetical protein